MSVGNYTLRKTYVDGDILSASDYVADHQQHIDNQNPIATGAYSDNVTQMRTTTNPGENNAESLAVTLAGELERLRYTLKEIKDKLNGAAVIQWYTKSWAVTVPNSTITSAKLANGATFIQYIRTTSSGVSIPFESETTLVSQGITLTRSRVRLRGTFNSTPLHIGVGDATVDLRLKRSGTLVAASTVYLASPSASGEICASGDIDFIDNPGPGTYTYTLSAFLDGTNVWTMIVNFNVLSMEEIA